MPSEGDKLREVSSVVKQPALRARILESAAELLQRLPLSKITMDDIARTAGVARQTVYKHFVSRDTLVIALFIDEIERTHRPRLLAIHKRRRNAKQLTNLFLEQLRLATDWILLSRTFDPSNAPRVAELVLSSTALGECNFALWGPILTDYQADGLLRNDLDLARTVRWMTYQHVWLLSHPNALTEDPKELRRYVHDFMTSALIR